MTFDSRMHPAHRIFVHRATGPVTESDIFGAVGRWFSNPAFSPDTPTLWDFRDVVVKLSLEDIRNLSPEFLAGVRSRKPFGKTAFLTSNSVAHSMAEEAVKLPLGATRRAFLNDYDAAIAWLLEG